MPPATSVVPATGAAPPVPFDEPASGGSIAPLGGASAAASPGPPELVPPELDVGLPSGPPDDPSPELPELLAAPVVVSSPEHAAIMAASRPVVRSHRRMIDQPCGGSISTEIEPRSR